MKRIFSIVVLISWVLLAKAQQEPVTSMFWNNYSMVNPANSGFDYRHFSTVQGRSQWVNLDRNPKTYWIGYDVKINSINSGVGISLIKDQYGSVQTSKIQLNYNYQFEFSEDHKLGVGLSVGYSSQDWDVYNYTFGPNIDPRVGFVNGSTALHQTLVNSNVGIKYKLKALSFGFSIVNLSESTYDYQGTWWYYEPTLRTYYVLASYTLELSEKWNLIPGVFFEGNQVSNFTDVNLRAELNKKFWFGSSLRVTDARELALMAGVNLWERLRMGYSYDLGISEYSDQTGGSHELLLTFAVQ